MVEEADYRSLSVVEKKKESKIFEQSETKPKNMFDHKRGKDTESDVQSTSKKQPFIISAVM